MKNLCALNIYENSLVGKQYSINFYINDKSMNKCIYENYCNDIRSVSYLVKNNEVMLGLMITNAELSMMHTYCSSSKGITEGFCK